MAITEEPFQLGVVVVTVHATDGISHIEDWNPKDAKEAKKYAAHTAHCSDVKSVDFEDHRTGKKATYTNLDL